MAVPAAAIGAAKMIGGAVGQVGIQLALEKAFFNKDVQQTTKQTESAFSKSFGRIGKTAKSAFSGMSNIVSKASSRIKNIFHKDMGIVGQAIRAAFGYFSLKAIWDFTRTSIQAASDTQAAWTGLYSIVNGTGKSFSEAKGFLEEYTNDGLIPLTDAITSYKNLAARGYSTKQIEQTMTALKDAAAFGRQSSYSYGEAIKSATEGLKNENSILVDNAGVTKNVAKMWDEYAASIGTTANNLTQQQKILAEVQGIMEETKFQQGDAAKYADTYAGKVAKLNTAFYNLKVTVGQVLTPIIELFLPVITKVINGLTTMFNKLKSIMAVFGLEMKEYIGGGTTSAISSATESASGLSSGLDSAGKTAQKTAKKIKRAFAGIDEINVLNMPNDSSSSGGSGGSGGGIGDIGTGSGGIGGGFEDTQETVTQNLEWLNRSAYDWGVAFGESINKGLNLIPWDKIQGGVVGVVSKVAQFLNGAVEGLDWHLLGSTFGEGFNTVIYGYNTWYETFDWANFGKSLGDGVNGIIDSVDWQATGKLFALNFNSIFETSSSFLGTVKWGDLGKNLIEGLNTTISTLDFTAVGKTLENGLNGAIDFMWQGISNFDFKNAGSKVAELVNNLSTAIKNTDWNKLGKTVSEAITGLLDMAQQFLKETDWGELVSGVIDGVVDFLVGIDWGKLLGEIAATLITIGGALVEGIWAGIKSAIVGVGKILWDILVQPIIDGVKLLFGINSPSTVFAEIGDFLIQGLWSGISGAKDWIVKKWGEVKGWFSNITKEAKVEIKQKWDDIKQKWSDLTTNIKNKTAEMKAKIATKWDDIKKNWSNITTNVKNKTADMKAKIATKWADIKKNWSNITTNIKDKTASIKAKVGTTWSNLKTTWNNLMSNFKDKTITIKAKIGEVVGNLKSTINDKIIKPINNKLPSIFPKIPYLAQGAWLKANNPRLAVVGDNKHEPEIVSPESKIYDQARKAVEDVGVTNTNQHFDFTIKLEYPDGRYLIKEINNTQIRDGYVSLLV